MMVAVADNHRQEPDEQRAEQQPSHDLVARDQPQAPGTPGPGPSEQEQRRQFEEFQRFQAYLRYTQSQGGDAQDAPSQEQFAEIQRQLGEVVASQQRTERELNPPLWKKVLRSHWLYRLVVLVILIVAASWVYGYFFGGSNQPDTPAVPKAPPGHEGGLNAAPPRPDRTVQAVYAGIATPGDATCNLFTQTGQAQFARDFGASDCPSAVRELRGRVTDRNAYAILHFGDAVTRKTANSATVSSCRADVTGGPSLGRFTLTKLPTGGWYVSAHAREHCTGGAQPTR